MPDRDTGPLLTVFSPVYLAQPYCFRYHCKFVCTVHVPGPCAASDNSRHVGPSLRPPEIQRGVQDALSLRQYGNLMVVRRHHLLQHRVFAFCGIPHPSPRLALSVSQCLHE